MRLSFPVPVLLSLLLAGCAASPLYVEGRSARSWAGAEIPRDARGEPIFERIQPPPPGAMSAARPVATAWTAPAPAAAEGDADGSQPSAPR